MEPHMDVSYLRSLTLDLLSRTNCGSSVTFVADALQAIQDNLDGLDRQRNQKGNLCIKAGTVLMLAILKKAQDGVLPQEYGREDWADVAQAVSSYAVCMDEQRYSAFVFSLAADYIDACAAALGAQIPPSTKDAVSALTEDLRTRTVAMGEGRIGEVDYIEENLWTSLEALLKLLSSQMACQVNEPGFSQLAEAIAQLAFEYGRFRLRKREQTLLDDLLAHQDGLDAELEEELEEYHASLAVESERFLDLVANAFASDIHERLMASVALARTAGVPEGELLSSPEKIDEFFLS